MMIYRKTLYIITNVPTVIPIRFANITDITSTPSMAPPNLMVRPLPTPEISPPKIAHSSRSVPANGDELDTSIGRIFVITNEASEYISTA